jgi:hypothetical protein
VTTIENETRRSPLATLLSDQRVLEAAQKILEGERRKRRAYSQPRSVVNQKDIAREVHLANAATREGIEQLADAAERCAQRIIHAEPIEVAG